MEIRRFKELEGKRTYYAVIGANNEDEAVKAVIRKKKESISKTYFDYLASRAVIAPYKDGLDGLWKARDRKDGQRCFMVWKEEK